MLTFFSYQFCSVQILRCLLNASCDYFDAMSRSGMQETRQEVIKLEDISVRGLKTVIDFIYSGELRLNIGKVFVWLQMYSHANYDHGCKVVQVRLRTESDSHIEWSINWSYFVGLSFLTLTTILTWTSQISIWRHYWRNATCNIPLASSIRLEAMRRVFMRNSQWRQLHICTQFGRSIFHTQFERLCAQVYPEKLCKIDKKWKLQETEHRTARVLRAKQSAQSISGNTSVQFGDWLVECRPKRAVRPFGKLDETRAISYNETGRICWYCVEMRIDQSERGMQ